ncbi:DNA polymerase III subunit beta family protein [Streptomyces sp. LE64]|uniref:DNA polymerase III subunit beta family protein n=1 Tax=Streptomyces sp. LE64 TaxID=3448653 RepID=UPI0040433796
MSNSELMPIGPFARRTGVTPSALRFYADCGLLPPAEVDPVSGYRYYHPDQVARTVELRRLREIAMPLADAEAVLGAGPDEAVRLIDAHVARVLGDAEAVRRTAARIKAARTGEAPGPPLAALAGPVLAAAVEQVLTATAREPCLPVLGGLHVEATPEAFTLTATDRYRLATRTLVPARPAPTPWSGTIDGDELRSSVPELRRSATVLVEATAHGLRLRPTDREDGHEHLCRLLSEEFPDYRRMLAELPEPTTRATVPKNLFLGALEANPGRRISLHFAPGRGVHVHADEDEPAAVPSLDPSPTPPLASPPGSAPVRPSGPLPAVVTGRDLRITFELTTLHPAVSTAVGPDLMLDLRGPDRPVTLRSADRGDLTTLAMPVRPTT